MGVQTDQGTIVVVEADPHIADLVDLSLRQAGYPALHAAHRDAGLAARAGRRRGAGVEGQVVARAARGLDPVRYRAGKAGLALSRQRLLDAVGGPGWYGDERPVDVHVRQLRKKLGEALPLATVWGVGYRL